MKGLIIRTVAVIMVMTAGVQCSSHEIRGEDASHEQSTPVRTPGVRGEDSPPSQSTPRHTPAAPSSQSVSFMDRPLVSTPSATFASILNSKGLTEVSAYNDLTTYSGEYRGMPVYVTIAAGADGKTSQIVVLFPTQDSKQIEELKQYIISCLSKKYSGCPVSNYGTTDGGYRQIYTVGKGFVAVGLGMNSLLSTSLTITYVADRDNYMPLTF